MNAVKGALSVLVFELAIYLLPGDHDAAFMALRGPTQALVILGGTAMMFGAVAIFFWGLIDNKTAK